MKRYVSEIFEPKPSQWGFRGDPYLWEDLKIAFSEIELPYSNKLFEIKVKELIEEFTGAEISKLDSIYVSKYAHGGMSSGGVSLTFWQDKAIPLLYLRLEGYNEILNITESPENSKSNKKNIIQKLFSKKSKVEIKEDELLEEAIDTIFKIGKKIGLEEDSKKYPIFSKTLVKCIGDGVFFYVDKEGYHYTVMKMGRTIKHYKNSNLEEILYPIFKDITSSLAFGYERKRVKKVNDFKGQLYNKQLELLNKIDKNYAIQYKKEYQNNN